MKEKEFQKGEILFHFGGALVTRHMPTPVRYIGTKLEGDAVSFVTVQRIGEGGELEIDCVEPGTLYRMTDLMDKVQYRFARDGEKFQEAIDNHIKNN